MELRVLEFKRPSFLFEELLQEDGTYKAGRRACSAVEFVAELDPFGPSFYDELVVVTGEDERWKLTGAHLALCPNRPATGVAGVHRYVVIYNNVVKL